MTLKTETFPVTFGLNDVLYSARSGKLPYTDVFAPDGREMLITES